MTAFPPPSTTQNPTIPTATLRIGDTETRIEAGKYVVIGSGAASDIRIKNPYISRRHALIGYKNGWFVEDLNSSNGTFVDRGRIDRVSLTGATAVSLGDPTAGVSVMIAPTIAGNLKDLPPAMLAATLPPALSDEVLFTLPLPPRLTEAASATPAFEGGLSVRNARFVVENNKVIVNNVSFNATRGTLTAVIGPSGAGKSTLASLISGVNVPTSGAIDFDGISIVNDYARAKEYIGLVPQDDVLHRQLRLGQALEYAAKLRLPDMTPVERQNQISRAVSQLDLDPHLNTRIDRLSGGQRKRASVAMELLTEPQLLILDEPTSGLDPALDRQLMYEFRKLADGGRSVLVITHSVAHLGICDQVLVLAPGGKTAFLGTEADAMDHFHETDWSGIFTQLQNDPDGCARRWLEIATMPPALPVPPTSSVAPPHTLSFGAQLLTLMRRQVSLLFADRGYSLFLLALPFVIGLLPMVAPGDAGLTQVQTAKNAAEPQMVLSLLIIGAMFMGISMSIRDLIGEKSIFLRERAVGLSPGAYLMSKIIVFGACSWIGAAITTAVLSLVKDLPTGDGVLGIGATTELFFALGCTINAGMILGLLLSSLVTSQNQAMPVLIVVLMLQMVLNGGLISLADTKAFNVVSYFAPARWAYMMGAVSIDLPGLLTIADDDDRALMESTAKPLDEMWTFDLSHWVSASGVLVAMMIVMATLTWVRLRTEKR